MKIPGYGRQDREKSYFFCLNLQGPVIGTDGNNRCSNQVFGRKRIFHIARNTKFRLGMSSKYLKQ